MKNKCRKLSYDGVGTDVSKLYFGIKKVFFNFITQTGNMFYFIVWPQNNFVLEGNSDTERSLLFNNSCHKNLKLKI